MSSLSPTMLLDFPQAVYRLCGEYYGTLDIGRLDLCSFLRNIYKFNVLKIMLTIYYVYKIEGQRTRKMLKTKSHTHQYQYSLRE